MWTPCRALCRAGLHINSRCGLLCGDSPQCAAEPLQERKESLVSWMLHWFFIEPLLSYKHVAIDTSTNKYPAQATLYQVVYTHTYIQYIYRYTYYTYILQLFRKSSS